MAANIINLFDQKTVTQFVTTPYRDAFSVPDAQFFAGFDPVAVAAASPSIRPIRGSAWRADISRSAQ